MSQAPLEANRLLDEMLNPRHKNLRQEYFYMVNDIKTLLNINHPRGIHATNMRTIIGNVNVIEKSGNIKQLDQYLLKVLPYISRLLSNLRYLGAFVVEKYR